MTNPQIFILSEKLLIILIERGHYQDLAKTEKLSSPNEPSSSNPIPHKEDLLSTEVKKIYHFS